MLILRGNLIRWDASIKFLSYQTSSAKIEMPKIPFLMRTALTEKEMTTCWVQRDGIYSRSLLRDKTRRKVERWKSELGL